MTIAGPVLMIARPLLDIPPTGWVGLATTAVGIPLLVSGSKKIKRIENELNTHNTSSLSIAPGFVFANQNKNPYPEISLKLKF